MPSLSFPRYAMNLAFASLHLQAILIFIRELSVLLSSLSSLSLPHINVASSSYSPSFLPPFASSSPYFLSPACVSFSTSRRSRVKPSATTGPADEKEISSLSFSSFPFSPVYSIFHPPSSVARLCVVLRRNNVATEPGQTSFLNLSWDNRLGVII